MAQTQLPGNLGHLDWTDWLRGLFAGAIKGGANSVYAGFAGIVLDSKDFNIYEPKLYALMGITFGFSAFMSTMDYLRVKPIPEYTKTTEIEERSPHSTIVTTGTGDGGRIEERSEHSTKVTKVVEEMKPAGVTTTVIDPPKTTIVEDSSGTDSKP